MSDGIGISVTRNTNYKCTFRDKSGSALLEAGHGRVNKTFRFADHTNELFQDCPKLYDVRNQLAPKRQREWNHTSCMDEDWLFAQRSQQFVFQHYSESSKYIQQYRYYHAVGGVGRKTMGDPRDLGIEPATRSDPCENWYDIPSDDEGSSSSCVPDMDLLTGKPNFEESIEETAHLSEEITNDLDEGANHELSTETSCVQTSHSSRQQSKLASTVITSPNDHQRAMVKTRNLNKTKRSDVNEDTCEQTKAKYNFLPQIKKCVTTPVVYKTFQNIRRMKLPDRTQAVCQKANTHKYISHQWIVETKLSPNTTTIGTSENLWQQFSTKTKMYLMNKEANQESIGSIKVSPKVLGSTAINYLRNTNNLSTADLPKKLDVQNTYLPKAKWFASNIDTRKKCSMDYKHSQNIKSPAKIQNELRLYRYENKRLSNIKTSITVPEIWTKSKDQNNCFPKIESSMTKRNGHRSYDAWNKCTPRVKELFMTKNTHRQSNTSVSYLQDVNGCATSSAFPQKPNTQNMCSPEVHKSTMNENDSKKSSVQNINVPKSGLIQNRAKVPSEEILSSRKNKKSIIREDFDNKYMEKNCYLPHPKEPIVDEIITRKKCDKDPNHSKMVKVSITNKDVFKECVSDKTSAVSKLNTTTDVHAKHQTQPKQHRSMSSARTPITREEIIEKALCLPRIQSFLVQTRLHRIPVTKSRSCQRPRSTFVVEDRKMTCSLPNCPPIVGCSVPILNGRQMCASNPSNAVKQHSTTHESSRRLPEQRQGITGNIRVSSSPRVSHYCTSKLPKKKNPKRVYMTWKEYVHHYLINPDAANATESSVTEDVSLSTVPSTGNTVDYSNVPSTGKQIGYWNAPSTSNGSLPASSADNIISSLNASSDSNNVSTLRASSATSTFSLANTSSAANTLSLMNVSAKGSKETLISDTRSHSITSKACFCVVKPLAKTRASNTYKSTAWTNISPKSKHQNKTDVG